MIVILDIMLFTMLIATALLALTVRNLLAAVTLLGGYSLFAALLFTGLQAVDVALVEAALGAGLSGILYIAAVLATSRHVRSAPRARGTPVVLVLIAAFIALMLYASQDLPDRGDPTAPAHQHVSPHYIEQTLQETQTPNVVASVLADYRSGDTLGETLVIFTAAISAALILYRRPDQRHVVIEHYDDAIPDVPDDPIPDGTDEGATPDVTDDGGGATP